MRRLLGISLFLPLACLVVCGQRSPGAIRTIDVYVIVRMEKGPPMANIKVELLSMTGTPMTAAYTDERGSAILPHVIPGRDYTLQLSGEGIETLTQSFEIQNQEMTHTEYVMMRRIEEVDASAPGGTVLASDLSAPGEAKKELGRGEKCAAGKDWNGAIEHYDKAIGVYPRYARAYRDLGIAYLMTGDKAKGRGALEHALSIDDKFAGAHLDLGRLQFVEGDKAGAEKNLMAAIAVAPTDLDALTLLAIVELDLGELDQAIATAQKVHTMPHPGHAVVHFVAGTGYKMQHKDADATTEYDLYLKEDPNGYFVQRARNALAELRVK